MVVADRRTQALSEPIVRNAQEQRQLQVIGDWLRARGYIEQAHPSREPITGMAPGTFSFRQVVTGIIDDGSPVNLPIDTVVQPLTATSSRIPVLIEAKSAGDYTNTNKRRKEEATKARQLCQAHGEGGRLVLFLCGYFNDGYLAYEAAEGLDWVWEHRVDDLAAFGL